MAERREQEKPLAPAIPVIIIDNPNPFPAEFIPRRRERCLKCCGCSAALFLILAVTILVLMLEVFHVKHPTLAINSVKIEGLDLLSNNTNLVGLINLTLVADVSIKNTNAASFKFHEAATNVYYDGKLVGESGAPVGEAEPWRTRRMNVLVDLMVDRLVGVSRFERDFEKGSLSIRTYTRVKGVVKIADVIKRSFVVKINCGMNVDLRSQVVQDRICRRDVSL